MSESANSDETTPTLFEWMGGLGPLRAMIDAFYDRVERNELFDNLFPGGVTEVAAHARRAVAGPR